ncbi:MAG: type II toxin-antitoxin system VapC family toxin [bacterium]
MLDTDSVSYALRGQGAVGARLLEHRPSELSISSITLAELKYGATLKRSRRLHGLIDTFVASVQVLSFDEDAARQYGRLAADLHEAGTPIGQADTLIAAHALSVGSTLVTNNMRHFERIKGLRTETWA